MFTRRVTAYTPSKAPRRISHVTASPVTSNGKFIRAHKAVYRAYRSSDPAPRGTRVCTHLHLASAAPKSTSRSTSRSTVHLTHWCNSSRTQGLGEGPAAGAIPCPCRPRCVCDQPQSHTYTRAQRARPTVPAAAAALPTLPTLPPPPSPAASPAGAAPAPTSSPARRRGT